MTTRYPLYFHPGDDETRLFKYQSTAGVIVDLTGYTATWTGTVEEASVTVAGTVNGPSGTVSVFVAGDSTTLLGAAGAFGGYVLKIQSPTSDDTTIAEGPLVLLGE